MNKEELLAAYAAGRRNFAGFDLRFADLRRADLTGADFRGAVFCHADLRGVDLRQANLSGANLSGSDLTRAKLSCAVLRHADLHHVDLHRADLFGADLSGANLRDSYFRRADLRGADLTGAELNYARLHGADLTGIIGFRFPGSPDPVELRRLVAKQILEHPELHDQGDQDFCGDNESCGTPCCVAGRACRLGGGARGHFIPTAALRLLHCDGYRLPSFAGSASRESIIRDLLVPIKDQND